MIWGRQQFIVMDIPDYEEADEYDFIDNDGYDPDEEEEIGLRESGMNTGVTEVGTKDVVRVK